MEGQIKEKSLKDILADLEYIFYNEEIKEENIIAEKEEIEEVEDND